MGRELEKKLVQGLVDFAIEEGRGYSVIQSPPPGAMLHLALTDSVTVAEKREIFKHFVFFSEGKIIRDGTALVRDGIQERRLYINFLSYLRDHSGINLTNDFRNLWENYPDRYPV